MSLAWNFVNDFAKKFLKRFISDISLFLIWSSCELWILLSLTNDLATSPFTSIICQSLSNSRRKSSNGVSRRKSPMAKWGCSTGEIRQLFLQAPKNFFPNLLKSLNRKQKEFFFCSKAKITLFHWRPTLRDVPSQLAAESRRVVTEFYRPVKKL